MPTGGAADNFAAILNSRVSRLESEAQRSTKSSSRGKSRTRRGIITVVNGDGTYTVAIVGADSTSAYLHVGVRAWNSDATFVFGQHVTLVWEGLRPLPWIQTGGGGAFGNTAVPVITSNLGYTA